MHFIESSIEIHIVITIVNKHISKNVIGKNRLTRIGRNTFGCVFLSQSKPATVLPMKIYSDSIEILTKNSTSSKIKKIKLEKAFDSKN